MKKKLIALGTVAAILFSACTNEFDNTQEINKGKYSTIVAGIVNTDTRVGITEQDQQSYSLFWQEGDKVVVNGVLSEPVNEMYDGQSSAEISVAGELTYPLQILYPSSIYASSNTVQIPTEQQYLQNSLANGYGIMLGYAESADADIAMNHVCGYIHVSVKGSATINKVALIANGHEYLSGEFTTTYNADAVSLVASSTADEHTPHISITCEEPIVLSSQATDFFFAVPAGNYAGGFSVRIIDSDNKVMIKNAYTAAGKNIEVGKVLDMPPFEFIATADNGINTPKDWSDMAHGVNPSAWANSDNVVLVNADIDMSGLSVPAMTLNDGQWTIDGQNHKIFNLTATHDALTGTGALLFNRVAAGCAIQDLQLGNSAGTFSSGKFSTEPDSKLTATLGSGIVYVSPFVGSLNGTMSGCVNNAGVQLKTSSGATQLFIGGLAATGERKNTYESKSSGNITHSTNNGHIFIERNDEGGAIKNLQLGGIYGRCTNNIVTGCTNNGAIYVRADAASAEFADTETAHLAIGGIIGKVGAFETEDKGTATIERNTNNGTVTFYASKELGDGFSIGGVVGVTTADISDCHNTKKLRLESTNATKQYSAGGVLGEAIKDQLTFSGLTNTAEVSLYVDAPGPHYLGGIIGKGYAGGDDTQSNNTVTGCTNSGKVAVHKPVRMYMGGICGGGPNITNSTNRGQVVSNADSKVLGNSALGGIAGNLAGNLYGNKSFGEIKCTNSSDSNVRLGGLSGRCNVSGLSIDDCAVSTKITGVSGANVGMLVGLAGPSMTAGSQKACYVYGTIIKGDISTTLDADNFSNYLKGVDQNLTVTNVQFANKNVQ